jgi:hypothetical protein
MESANKTATISASRTPATYRCPVCGLVPGLKTEDPLGIEQHKWLVHTKNDPAVEHWKAQRKAGTSRHDDPYY